MSYFWQHKYFFHHTRLKILPDTFHSDIFYTCPAACTSVHREGKLRFYLRWSVSVQAYDQKVFAPELSVTNIVQTQSTPSISVKVISIYLHSLIKYCPKTINLQSTHIVLPYSTTSLVNIWPYSPKFEICGKYIKIKAQSRVEVCTYICPYVSVLIPKLKPSKRF